MSYTYLTTEELSERIKYDPRTIRNSLKDSVLIEGVHYIRPFSGRKILDLWEKIEKDMARPVSIDSLMNDRWVQFVQDRGSSSSTFATEVYVVVNKRSCPTHLQIVNVSPIFWNASKRRYWSEHLITQLTSRTQTVLSDSATLTP